MTTQLAFEAIAGTAPLKSRPELIWMGFTPDTHFDVAERIFTERYGHKPQTELRTPGALLIGPIEETDANLHAD